MSLLLVWSPATLIVAILAGLGVGYWMVGGVAANPAWVSTTATAGKLGILVAGLTAVVGIVFYVGQATATAAEGGPWDRVVSRAGLWIIYGVFLGIGTWRRVSDHVEARTTAARLRAEKELGTPRESHR